MQPTFFRLPFQRGNVKLLRYSGGNKNFKFGDIVHPLFTASNQCSRDNMPKTKTSALMNLHLESKALVSAHHACNQMNKQNIVSSSAGPFQNMDDFAVLELFKSMLSAPYPPKEYICGLVLSYCFNTGHLLFGRQCQGHMLKSGFMHTRDMEVVDSSSNFGLDIHFCNLMFVKLIEEGYLNEALILLSRMSALDKVWNKATYIGIFGLCAGLKDLDLGRRFHNKLLRSCVIVDVSVCTEMIRMYGTCKDNIVTAAKVFDMYEAGNGVIWTAMLAVLSQHQIIEEVLELFCDMHHEDVAPNESTFQIVLYGSAGLESLRYGNLIHAVAHKTGFCNGPHKVVNDALINMYSRNGDIKAAERVFSCTTNNYRDIKTWNMMIDGYLFHGLGYKSLALFEKMLKKGGKDPDTYTFGSVLTTCAHLGLVEKGYYYLYELMKQKGVEPGLEHYMAIVDMLIKAGRPTEAIHFILLTPVKWSKYAWIALLRHCQRHHQNSSLFSLVAELIPIDMEIAVNDHYRIERLCDLPQPIEIEERGKCVMEINKETRIFDKIDYRRGIFDMVHKLFGQLTTAPLLPRIDIFEENYDDWNELEGITYHSEVVAVAYALLNTHVILPIRIIKTMGKICDSCHSLIKSISKDHHRLIIVRDDHIWHNFQYGRCSCGDKW